MTTLTAKPTRKEALAQGLKRYYGKVCAKHPALKGERRVTDGCCLGCHNQRSVMWRLNHKEPRAAKRCRDVRYRAKNRVKLRERHRTHSARYYEANRDKALAAVRKWMAARPGLGAAYVQRRRSAKVNRTPNWLTSADFKTIEGFYAEAARLSNATGVQYVVDHYYPLRCKTVSGLHVPLNLQVIPATDNRRKSNRHPEI